MFQCHSPKSTHENQPFDGQGAGTDNDNYAQ